MSSTFLTELRHAREHDPGRPLVTFYDGATGERVELSVQTSCNWVDKIANLLTDELMLDPGRTVHLDLPTHWQSAVTIAGTWAAGLNVSLGAPPDDVALTVVGPDAREEPGRAVGEVLACSLRPMAGPFTEELPPGWLDFAREVPPQPDALISPVDVAADSVALIVSQAGSSHAELYEQACGAAADIGLTGGGRLITDANPARPSGIAAALVGPVVAGASVVLVTNCDAQRLATIGEQERVTARFWLAAG